MLTLVKNFILSLSSSHSDLVSKNLIRSSRCSSSRVWWTSETQHSIMIIDSRDQRGPDVIMGNCDKPAWLWARQSWMLETKQKYRQFNTKWFPYFFFLTCWDWGVGGLGKYTFRMLTLHCAFGLLLVCLYCKWDVCQFYQSEVIARCLINSCKWGKSLVLLF